MKPVTFELRQGPATFFPAGCIHWPVGQKELIRQWVDRVDKARNAVALLMGDTFDLGRTHFRDHIRTYRADQNSQLSLDKMVRHEVESLASLLLPISDKIAGAILGNHYWTFSDETNSEQYLCQLLEIPYLGPVGLVRVDFRGEKSVEDSVVIYAHHHGGGKGGRTTGADVAVLERTELQYDADIYVAGHTHRRFGFKLPKLGVTRRGAPRVTSKTKVLVRSGAFLEGFKEDEPSATQPHHPGYAEVNALRPTDLGWVEVSIRPTKDSSGQRGFDYRLSY
jgi:hypothetical protein